MANVSSSDKPVAMLEVSVRAEFEADGQCFADARVQPVEFEAADHTDGHRRNAEPASLSNAGGRRLAQRLRS